jgi:hypothetical protein
VAKIPKELRELAKFLDKFGYVLAVPFNDISVPGYIGGFDEKGREVIVDTGKCLAKVSRNKPAKVVLGSFKKSSVFSLKSFLNLFGGLLNVTSDFSFARSVSLDFPNALLESDFITEIDVQEVLPTISRPCLKALLDPSNFLIMQVLQTDALRYSFELKRKATAEAKADITAKFKGMKIGDATVELDWQSETGFSILLSGAKLTIGYKPARHSLTSLSPAVFYKSTTPRS